MYICLNKQNINCILDCVLFFFIQIKNYNLGSFFSYLANPHNQVGIYIASDPLSPEDYYFEVEILDSGNLATIGEIWCHNIKDKLNEN